MKKFIVLLLSALCVAACTLGLAACDETQVDVTEISLSETRLTLEIGGEATLVATVLPDDAADKTVSWSVSDGSVASVKDGKVKALSAGNTTVTASAGGKRADCSVTVKANNVPVEGIILNTNSILIFGNVGEELTARIMPDDATDKTVEWSAEPEGIVTVDGGRLTPVSQGIATVTASAQGQSASCKVTVSKDGLEYVPSEDGQSYTVQSNYFGYVEWADELTETVQIAPSFNGKPVTAVGEWAFDGEIKNKIKFLKIPASVTEIDFNSIYNCIYLESITVDESNSAYTGVDGIIYDKAVTECLFVPYGISGTVTVPQTITTISDGMFQNRTKLTGVKMHDDITVIGESAFSGCTSLNSVTIPANVTEIKKNAFNCENLWEIYNLSQLNIRIEDDPWNATFGGIGLNALNILYNENEPSGIDRRADGYTFYNAREKVYLVEYPADTADLVLPADYNGAEYEINKNLFDGNRILKSVVLSDGVTAVGDYAFSSCSNLESVTFGNSLKTLGMYAFSGCEKLIGIVLPASVTEIGDNAFAGCDGLVEADLSGVTEIGSRMFADCTSLKTVKLSAGIRWLGSTFSGCTGLEEIKFNGSVQQWTDIPKNSGWDRDTGNYVVICDDGTVEKQ